MKKSWCQYLALAFLIFSFSCGNERKEESIEDNNYEIAKNSNEPLTEMDFIEFQPLLNLKDDKVYVINFWATWCKPCIKEMPYFEKINADYSEEVEVILVSLDMPSMKESHLIPFIEKHNLNSRVINLNDPDSNMWIPLVDPEWSGAIPATYIYNKNSSSFYEKSFTFEELELEVQKFINNN